MNRMKYKEILAFVDNRSIYIFLLTHISIFYIKSIFN